MGLGYVELPLAVALAGAGFRVTGVDADPGKVAALGAGDSHLEDRKISSVELTPRDVASADCVMVATDHEAVDLPMVVEHAPKVVDLRNAVRRRLGSRLPAHVDVLRPRLCRTWPEIWR